MLEADGSWADFPPPLACGSANARLGKAFIDETATKDTHAREKCLATSQKSGHQRSIPT
jgi:hypothetical protein